MTLQTWSPNPDQLPHLHLKGSQGPQFSGLLIVQSQWKPRVVGRSLGLSASLTLSRNDLKPRQHLRVGQSTQQCFLDTLLRVLTFSKRFVEINSYTIHRSFLKLLYLYTIYVDHIHLFLSTHQLPQRFIPSHLPSNFKWFLSFI